MQELSKLFLSLLYYQLLSWLEATFKFLKKLKVIYDIAINYTTINFKNKMEEFEEK